MTNKKRKIIKFSHAYHFQKIVRELQEQHEKLGKKCQKDKNMVGEVNFMKVRFFESIVFLLHHSVGNILTGDGDFKLEPSPLFFQAPFYK